MQPDQRPMSEIIAAAFDTTLLGAEHRSIADCAALAERELEAAGFGRVQALMVEIEHRNVDPLPAQVRAS